MRWFRKKRHVGIFCALSLALISLGTMPAGATVIRFGDGTGNTSAPLNDPGWDNVGRLNGAGAVYLQDRWVLTAAHVAQGSVDFGGQSYAMEPGSWQQLHQPGDASTLADLALFRLLDTPVGLFDVAVSASAIPLGAEVVGIGNGKDRAAPMSYWDANWDPTTPPGEHSGFELLSTRTKRWGKNHIDGTGEIAYDGSPLLTHGLVMDFDAEGGAGGDEMQVVLGDSGGGLFYDRGGAWELAGIILARGSADPNQPLDYVAFGNQSYAADLSQYQPQIMGIVPEPSTLAMLLGLGASCLFHAARNRARRR